MTSTTTDRQQAETERRMAVEAAIEDCRARPIREVAAELQLGLEEKSGWLSGPCPVCGGHDRFNINTRDGGFFCRKGCEARGSGPIDLVMVTLRLEFMDAVREMHGDLPEKVTQEELDRRRAQRAKAEEKRAAEAERHREKAIEGARGIWTRARGQGMQPVRDYLALRGLTPERLPELPGCLRYLPDQAYVLKRVVDGRRELVTMHRGPAMIAAIQGPDGRLTCVHQTWFDLSRPKGRPEILWQGERQRNKLTRGSQLAAERSAARVFSNGLQPSGVLQSKDTLTPEQRETMQAVLDRYAGSEKAGKVMVLEAGLEFKTVQWNPEDVQLLETRRFQVEEICRWFGVPPVVIGHAGAGQTMWGTGVEAILMGWLRTGINPILVRNEARLNAETIPPAKRGKWFWQYDREAMLQMDSKAKGVFLSTMATSGTMTANERRERLGLEPHSDPQANDLLGQTALAPLRDLNGRGAGNGGE